MRYESPTTTKEAVTLLSREKGKAHILAGGTDLLVRLRMDMIEPDLMVDIKRIPAMNEIKKTPTGAFKVGAAVSGIRLGANKALTKAWPGVVEATNLIGSDQIQGRCTMVGNLCNASPAADSVPALIAAGAKANVVGKKRRTVAVEDIATGPGKTSLAKGEIIESITLPKRPPKSGDAYLRFIPRTEMDIAVVGVAISLTLKKGVVASARVALGAVAATALLVPEAAKAIIGSTLDDDALDALAAACSAACKPIDDKRGTVEYRTKVAGVLARRAAKIAFERAGG